MSHLPLNLELQYRLIVTRSNKLIVPGGSVGKASARNAGDLDDVEDQIRSTTNTQAREDF